MKCVNCNTELNDNNLICPNCGKNNGLDEVNFVDLDEQEKVNESTPPPTLNVNNENLTKNSKDINTVSEGINYIKENKNKDYDYQKQENKDSVNIEIPKVVIPINPDPNSKDIPIITNTKEEIDANLNTVDNKQKKKIKLNFNIKGIKLSTVLVALLFLGIGLLLGQQLFSKNVCVSTNPSSVITNKTKFVSDGKNNITNIGDFTFKIPTQYVYDKGNKGLYIYDGNDTYRIFIRADKGDFSLLENAKKSIAESLRQNSVTINNRLDTSVDDINFLVYETTVNLTNRLICFTDASNGYIYYVEIITSSNKYDYDILKIVADILKNATYEQSSTNMEGINVYDVSDIAIVASVEYSKIN